MTGLAATMGADPPAATAIADALAARGTDLASWRAGCAHLVVRAAIPAVHELGGGGGALLLDGDASPSTLAAGYAGGGVRTLVAGRDPYTVILVDLARDALVLARNGDGPPLYWAQHGGALLAASEPVALLAGGVPAEPDPAVVERFLATGACDDGPATFFAGVRRVLPGQVVEVTRPPGAAACRVRVHEPPAAPAVTAEAALAAADLSGRIGVRLGCGVGAAAVLGAVLGRPDRPQPLPVFSTSFPELATADSSAYCAAGLLGPYALGAARHRALPFFADELDVDAYLADLGEPTPALDDWLRWAIARRVAGEVDVLVDAGAGSHLSRLADRVASRFGVALCLPLRDVPEPARKAELAAVVERTLPSSAAGFVAAEAGRGPEALLADLLRRMRAELVTTFLRPRMGDGLAETLALVAGDRVDVAALWRRYLVERWLRSLRALRVDHGVLARPAAQLAEILHDRGARAVKTEVFAEGDKLPEKIAWYVGEELSQSPVEADWHVLLAAKPVAVMQGRARSLWEIRPGLAARLLHRARRSGQAKPATPWASQPGRGRRVTPWVLQVAIDEAGRWRVLGAAAAGLVGGAGWYARIAGPAVRAVREPREDALPPAHVSVVPAPAEPDRVAADVVAALRTAVPDATYQRLGGCAVVTSAGEVLGWAAGPGNPPRLDRVGDLFGDDHTPIVVAGVDPH